jgi:hypothetical protein
MKKLLALLAISLITMEAAAISPGHAPLGVTGSRPDPLDPAPPGEADVLVCIDIDASPMLFADLTQRYVDAFMAAGATSVSTCSVESPGGDINFPIDLNADNYPIVVVLTSENWFSTPSNLGPADEAALAGYLDDGGCLLLVGQDYMFGTHPDMNAPTACYGFPRDYLGLDVCYQDFEVPRGSRGAGGAVQGSRSNVATITGSAGWLFVGVAITLTAATVFLSMPFFTDRADPISRAGLVFDYEGQFGSGQGVAVYHATRGFKTIWSGVELSAAPTDDFHDVISVIYDWFLEGSPVSRQSWGAIKAMYR